MTPERFGRSSSRCARPGGRLPARAGAPARQALRAAEAVHQILLPFTGTEISRRAVRRRPAPGASRGRDADARLPRRGAEAAAARLRDPGRGGEGDADAGGDRTARRPARACRSTPASSAAAAIATRSAACSRRRPFDRVVVSATATGAAGFSGDDLVWLLDKAPAEVLILRPGPEDHRVLSA